MARAVVGLSSLVSETEAGWDGFTALYERTLDDVWRFTFESSGWSGSVTEMVVSRVYADAVVEHRTGTAVDPEWLHAHVERTLGERRSLRRSRSSSRAGITPPPEFADELLTLLEREWYFAGVGAAAVAPTTVTAETNEPTAETTAHVRNWLIAAAVVSLLAGVLFAAAGDRPHAARPPPARAATAVRSVEISFRLAVQWVPAAQDVQFNGLPITASTVSGSASGALSGDVTGMALTVTRDANGAVAELVMLHLDGSVLDCGSGPIGLRVVGDGESFAWDLVGVGGALGGVRGAGVADGPLPSASFSGEIACSTIDARSGALALQPETAPTLSESVDITYGVRSSGASVQLGRGTFTTWSIGDRPFTLAAIALAGAPVARLLVGPSLLCPGLDTAELLAGDGSWTWASVPGATYAAHGHDVTTSTATGLDVHRSGWIDCLAGSRAAPVALTFELAAQQSESVEADAPPGAASAQSARIDGTLSGELEGTIEGLTVAMDRPGGQSVTLTIVRFEGTSTACGTGSVYLRLVGAGDAWGWELIPAKSGAFASARGSGSGSGPLDAAELSGAIVCDSDQRSARNSTALQPAHAPDGSTLVDQRFSWVASSKSQSLSWSGVLNSRYEVSSIDGRPTAALTLDNPAGLSTLASSPMSACGNGTVELWIGVPTLTEWTWTPIPGQSGPGDLPHGRGRDKVVMNQGRDGWDVHRTGWVDCNSTASSAPMIGP